VFGARLSGTRGDAAAVVMTAHVGAASLFVAARKIELESGCKMQANPLLEEHSALARTRRKP